MTDKELTIEDIQVGILYQGKRRIVDFAGNANDRIVLWISTDKQ